MAGEILAPGEVFARARPALGALTHCYGGLLFLTPAGRIAAKGTIVLVKVDNDHLVFTAGHVAQRLMEEPGFIAVRPPEVTPEKALGGIIHAPDLHPVAPADVVWLSKELDVAAIRPPQTLLARSHLRWFDSTACVAATRSVRRIQHQSEHSLLTVIMGCPNYAHLRESEYDTISFIPMYSYISRLDQSSWDGIQRVPQIHLEIDDGSKRAQPELEGIRGQMVAALRDQDAQDTRLGGFSGGPIVVIGNDGEFLIGIVTEGEHVFGVEARAFGIAWDDIASNLRR